MLLLRCWPKNQDIKNLAEMMIFFFKYLVVNTSMNIHKPLNALLAFFIKVRIVSDRFKTTSKTSLSQIHDMLILKQTSKLPQK